MTQPATPPVTLLAAQSPLGSRPQLSTGDQADRCTGQRERGHAHPSQRVRERSSLLSRLARLGARAGRHLHRVVTGAGAPAVAERGAAAVWMITVTFAVALVVGLVVDGSARMNAVQTADHAAAEAARAGAQAVPESTVRRRGVAASPSIAQAVAAANSYLAAAGVSGSVAAGAGGGLVVTALVPWRPVFLSAVGVGSSVVEGRAEVSLVQSVEGSPS